MPEEKSDGTGHRHVLVTALGLNPRLSRYQLGGDTYETTLAPVALVNLLPPAERPDTVYALCTEQSGKDTYELLAEQLRGTCTVVKVDVPDGETEESLPQFLHQVTRALPQGSGLELTVDFTHGYRHHSFLMVMAILYLTALRQVKIRAAYYGLLGAPQSRPASTSSQDAAPDTRECPLLDVRPLLELPRWLHAVEMLETTGSAAAMGRLIGEYGERGLPAELAKLLHGFTESYQSGLPLELARDVAALAERAKPLRKLLNQRNLPLADELVNQFADRIRTYRQPSAHTSGGGWKQTVPLDEAELHRQAALIDSLRESGALPSAFGLMREWTVSWVLWRLGTTDGAWKQEPRRSAENWLGRLLSLNKLSSNPLTEEQRRLAEFWQQLAGVRNAYHHHGMRKGVVASADDQFRHDVSAVDRYWRELRECPQLDLHLPVDPTGTILVSPIGTRPGVLYSAVEAVRSRGSDPDYCLVICSTDTEASAVEALDRAGFAGHRDLLRLRDPYGGTDEFDGAVKERVRTLLGAKQAYINLTGGTTLMGLLADRFAQQSRELGPQVRRFGLIDRRPAAEQAADPYQAGEPYWLDDEERIHELG